MLYFISGYVLYYIWVVVIVLVLGKTLYLGVSTCVVYWTV